MGIICLLNWAIRDRGFHSRSESCIKPLEILLEVLFNMRQGPNGVKTVVS